MADAIDRFFKISERGSTIAREIKGGGYTFLTASYILLVNPQILGAAGLDVKHVVAATALSSALASAICGLLGNFPVGIAPGMGLNAFLVFSQVLGIGVSVHQALAGCMVAAVIVGVLAVVRALAAILAIVPNTVKTATVVGMGLLLSFIGLQTAGVVVADKETMVGLGNLLSLECILALLGLALLTSMHYLAVPGSILIGIVVTALAYWGIRGPWPHQFLDLPHLAIYKLDFSQLLALDGAAYSAVFAYALVMIFDVGGCIFGLGSLAGLVKDGSVEGATWVYVAAAVGSALGAATGTTPLIIAAESAVGIKEGARTGLAACVISVCFLLSMFIAPFLQSIPTVATAPVLVLVGAMMMGESAHIDWGRMNVALPAFLTMVIQPFTFSIANGIYAGLIFSILLFFLTGDFIPYAKKLLYNETADDEDDELEAPLLEGGVGGRSLSRSVSVADRVVNVSKALSARTYSQTYSMLLNTKGEHMPAGGDHY